MKIAHIQRWIIFTPHEAHSGTISALTEVVDPLLTVGTARRVPRVENMDDRQTAAAGQHWTGEPLKHRLRSLLSDILYTINGAI